MSEAEMIPRRELVPSDDQGKSGYRYVDAPEFIALAISARKLVRADEWNAGLAGLLDLTTGERIVIDRDLLFSLPLPPATKIK
jgi:hypothetical protein